MRYAVSIFLLFLMKLLFWNCQGAATARFSRILKLFIAEYKPSDVALLETRVNGLKLMALFGV